MMKRASVILVAAVLAAATACEEHGVTGLLAGGVDRRDLVGFWTGTAEITGTDDVVTHVRTQTTEDGYEFRVALRLRKDRRFSLHSFGYAATAGTTRTVCTGVWDVDGRRLEFFPDTQCRALPLSRYLIGHGFGDRMTLRASTGRNASGGTTAGDINVFISLDRD